MIRSLVTALAALFCLLTPFIGARAEDIVDMSGRKVVVPDAIRSVYAMTHAMPLVIAVAPDELAGFASPRAMSARALRLLPPQLGALPNLGGGPQANLEKLKDLKLDLALGWTSPGEQYPARQIERIGLPVVNIDVDRLDQYPATLRFLGKLFRREARGEALAAALEHQAASVKAATASLKDADKPRVYYAESLDGLTTQCESSERVEVIALAGGVNAVRCEAAAAMAGAYPLGMEKLLTLDPDVIVARFPATAVAIRQDPRWSQLKAVREDKVYAAPTDPFNWFDRPPSYMRALGARWLAGKLHPDLQLGDLRAETRAFYALFFGVTPSEADLDLVLQP